MSSGSETELKAMVWSMGVDGMALICQIAEVIAGNETPVLLNDLPEGITQSDVPGFLDKYGYKARPSNHSRLWDAPTKPVNSAGQGGSCFFKGTCLSQTSRRVFFRPRMPLSGFNGKTYRCSLSMFVAIPKHLGQTDQSLLLSWRGPFKSSMTWCLISNFSSCLECLHIDSGWWAHVLWCNSFAMQLPFESFVQASSLLDLDEHWRTLLLSQVKCALAEPESWSMAQEDGRCIFLERSFAILPGQNGRAS